MTKTDYLCPTCIHANIGKTHAVRVNKYGYITHTTELTTFCTKKGRYVLKQLTTCKHYQNQRLQ